MNFKKPYTAIIRKSRVEYVGICLELNVSARGRDLFEVEANLKNAINDYLSYIKEAKLKCEPIPLDELVEFLKETEPEGTNQKKKPIYRALELHEVPLYV